MNTTTQTTAPRNRIEREAHFHGMLVRERENERILATMLRRYEAADYSVATVDAIATALSRSTERIAELRGILRSL